VKKVSDETRENPYIVPALARGLRLLELISASPAGVLPGELGSAGIPPATLFRMLNTLSEFGCIRKDGDGRYRITGKLCQMAFQALDSTSLVSFAERPMRKLRDQIGETVLLGIIHGGHGVILHQEISRYPVKVVLEIGHNFPLHSAAPAKAIISHLAPEDQEELISQISFTRFTAKTITDAASFREELQKVRRDSAAFDCGEEDADIRCAAVPVFDRRKRVAAALWISGPASRLTDEKMRTAVPLLQTAAAEIFS